MSCHSQGGSERGPTGSASSDQGSPVPLLSLAATSSAGPNVSENQQPSSEGKNESILPEPGVQRPQSYIIDGTSTLPIHGSMRPISTVLSDQPAEQFDSLYDTLPTDMKKSKPKVSVCILGV